MKLRDNTDTLWLEWKLIKLKQLLSKIPSQNNDASSSYKINLGNKCFNTSYSTKAIWTPHVSHTDPDKRGWRRAVRITDVWQRYHCHANPFRTLLKSSGYKDQRNIQQERRIHLFTVRKNVGSHFSPNPQWSLGQYRDIEYKTLKEYKQ